MPTKPNVDNRRMIQLDVLRGVAILLVMCNHTVIYPVNSGRFQPISRSLGNIGWTGVVLFFVLSGFLIGGLLMQELQNFGKLDVRRFLIRRAFKIWPVYYLYLVFLFVLITWRWGGNWNIAFHELVPNLVHLQNYSHHQMTVGSHTWSLAVEEQFYLVLPILLLFLASANLKRINWIPAIAIGLNGLCLLLRLLHHGQVFYPWTIQNPTHLRVDSLFTGVLLAYWYHFRPDLFAQIARRRSLLLAVGILCVLPTALFQVSKTEFIWTFGYTALSIGYACLLIFLVTTKPGEGTLGRWLNSMWARGLAGVGAFSYSIYVWHPDLVQHPVRNLCEHGWLHGMPPELRWLIATLFFMAASILVGIVMAKAVETPSLALRNRLFPARASALTGKR